MAHFRAMKSIAIPPKTNAVGKNENHKTQLTALELVAERLDGKQKQKNAKCAMLCNGKEKQHEKKNRGGKKPMRC